MDKENKVVKGLNIKSLMDKFFNKYIKKHFNEVHSIDFIISDLGEIMGDGGRGIKILRNDNPVRTNNPDWFPPKAQQTDYICTFLKQLMDNNLGTKDSYVGLKVDVVSGDTVYTWDVKSVDYYENSGTVILRTDPRQGITIECPAIVRLYINPLLTSKAVSSIIYDSIVTKESKYNFILGERNIHKGEDNVWIFGKNNISGETNHNSLINGYNNDVDSYGNIVIGDNNKHRSLLGVTIGRYIKNFKQNSFLFGTGHDNSNGSSHEVVFGKYSKIEADTVFAIGNGENENSRHNLFELKSGGEILDKDGVDVRGYTTRFIISKYENNKYIFEDDDISQGVLERIYRHYHKNEWVPVDITLFTLRSDLNIKDEFNNTYRLVNGTIHLYLHENNDTNPPYIYFSGIFNGVVVANDTNIRYMVSNNVGVSFYKENGSWHSKHITLYNNPITNKCAIEIV